VRLFLAQQHGAFKTEHGSYIRFGSKGSPDIIVVCQGGKFCGLEVKTDTVVVYLLCPVVDFAGGAALRALSWSRWPTYPMYPAPARKTTRIAAHKIDTQRKTERVPRLSWRRDIISGIVLSPS
jgi:hypothetical protein